MIKIVRGGLKERYNRYVTRDRNPEMMNSEFGVVYLAKGEEFSLTTEEEYVFVLNRGEVIFSWDGEERHVRRDDCFREEPYILHVHTGTDVKIACISEDAEINAANALNENIFPNRFYSPGELLSSGVVDAVRIDGRAKREKRVFWDRTVCPGTNLFCGELIVYPGCWACYPPHLHTEPEIYYYKFLPECGYGFGEFGEDDAVKLLNRSVSCNPGGQVHSQCTAPGYACYIMWIQRLQDNGRDIDFVTDPRHAWLEEENVSYFPDKVSREREDGK